MENHSSSHIYLSEKFEGDELKVFSGPGEMKIFQDHTF